MADTVVHAIEHIVSTPGVCGGKPRIAGHRIKVQFVVEDVRHGMTADQIVEAYELQPAQVYAALAYYYDHREEIDRQIEEDEAYVEKMMAEERKKGPDPLMQRLDRLGLTLEQAHTLIDYYSEHREEVDQAVTEAGLDDWNVPNMEKWVKAGLVEKIGKVE